MTWGVDASCARGHGPKRAWIGQRAVLCCQATEMSPDGGVAVLAERPSEDSKVLGPNPAGLGDLAPVHLGRDVGRGGAGCPPDREPVAVKLGGLIRGEISAPGTVVHHAGHRRALVPARADAEDTRD